RSRRRFLLGLEPQTGKGDDSPVVCRGLRRTRHLVLGRLVERRPPGRAHRHGRRPSSRSTTTLRTTLKARAAREVWNWFDNVFTDQEAPKKRKPGGAAALGDKTPWVAEL